MLEVHWSTFGASVGAWRFGGLGVWRLEHWRYISAHLEVVSVVSRVCNA